MRRRALLLLTTMALFLLVASGAAMAETSNGLIYFGCNSFGGGICSIDPTASNSQPTFVRDGGNLFDISRDRTTIVYQRSGFSNQDPGPFYTASLSGGPYSEFSEVEITNLSASLKDMTAPTFSPDGETIYFRGRHVVDPPEGVSDPYIDAFAIYSVPTEGGEATRVPIDWTNSDGTARNIGSFALSHDGSTFAINGPFGIFTVPVSGGAPTRVNNDSCGGAQYPSFSPDDQMIVYVSRIWSGDNCTGTSHQTVYTTPVNNDGTSPGTPLFPEDAKDTNIHDSKLWPTYSPDGNYIAFANWLEGTTDYLVTVPDSGGTTKNVTPCSFCVPVWIEKPPPDTTIYSGPSGIVSSTSASFGFFSDRSDATFECKLDDGAFESCTSPKQYTSLSQGLHTFEVRSTTSLGTDATPATYTWRVDTIPPETTINSGPSGTINTDTATFRFSANESDSNFMCTIDQHTWYACTSPKTYTGLSEGTYTFEVWAYDNAHNAEPTPARRTFTVDLSSPPAIPHVTDTNPNDGDIGVARTIKPTLTFDTALNPATVNPQNVKLQTYSTNAGKWVTISSTPTYDNKVITVSPANTLGSQKRYRVVLNTNIESSTNANLQEPYRFRFTTR